MNSHTYNNEGHFPSECHMKFCTNCNTYIHQTNDCTYNKQHRDRSLAIHQGQPQLNNMRREPIGRNLSINQDKGQVPLNQQYYKKEDTMRINTL